MSQGPEQRLLEAFGLKPREMDSIKWWKIDQIIFDEDVTGMGHGSRKRAAA